MASFLLSSGDGDKTIYLWVRDTNGCVAPTGTQQTILLDTLPPVAPTVTLRDAATGDGSVANSPDLEIEIVSSADTAAWCLVELPETAPFPMIPAATVWFLWRA